MEKKEREKLWTGKQEKQKDKGRKETIDVGGKRKCERKGIKTQEGNTVKVERK